MMYRIFVWGVNFKTAPVEQRELLACSREDAYYLLPPLKTIRGIREIILLSTCNRVEVYTVAEDYEPMNRLVLELLQLKGVDTRLRKNSFFLEDGLAVAHVFKVASGLESMVVGETQIVSQFKEAYRVARELHCTGKVLNRLYEKALRTAKRVRTETGISRNAVSVSYVAVELAKRIFGSLARTKVLLVGAGEMAELSAKYLRKLQAHLFISNRTYERAVELAKELQGHVLRFEELSEHLHDFDIVIVSTGSKKFVIDHQMVKKAIRRRNYKPIFFIDISVPRNVDPEVNEIDEVFLYNIDDLQEVAEKNLRERLKEKEKGEIIVWDEVSKFMKWLEFLRVEKEIVNIKEAWKDVEEREPRVRRLVHLAVEEIRKDPSLAEKLVKIFLQEVEYADSERRLSHVHNRAYGA
ncbi:MAG: glutamyl-tRNA reductase [Aquificaceae bacterium]|jgi:glutamyl-tRNA reductase|uniref:glutamyl-tRNA reductase n=1 Tax=Hydrogenobacter sp. Uz 6-8 TaxID=3384828 RepID=UPI00309AB0D5